VDSIDHVDLVVSDLDRSLPFYLGLLGPLGFGDPGEIVGERGERVVYISSGKHGAIGLRERQSGGDAFDRYELGIHHLALSAASREQVDEIWQWARENGAEVEIEPREYDYSPGYYAVFLHDPDGIKLEIVHRP
jgi:glyoxylase I family protein